MPKNQVPHIRSDEVWMSIINDCRRSGLCDADWCRENHIAISSFYSAIRRLREKSYAIPRLQKSPVLDLTKAAPDIVQIGIIPDEEQPCQTASSFNQSSRPTMEIYLKGVDIRLYNDVSPTLLTQVLTILKGSLC